MKPLAELINTTEPAWSLIQDWLSSARNNPEILPRDKAKAEEELLHTQVSTRSPMGAVIYETGGILIDHGWLRILGSGSPQLDRGLYSWNKGKTFEKEGEAPSHLLIADDILGGYFAINAGGIGSEMGNVYYLAQDTLEWEDLGCGYSGFLEWALTGNLEQFYGLFRWKSWIPDVTAANGDQVFSFVPFLWSKEGKDIEALSRRLVPVEEHYQLTQEFRRQLNG